MNSRRVGNTYAEVRAAIGGGSSPKPCSLSTRRKSRGPFRYLPSWSAATEVRPSMTYPSSFADPMYRTAPVAFSIATMSLARIAWEFRVAR